MKKIKIKGAFSGSVNNSARVEVYKPNPDGYDNVRTFDNDFTMTVDDLLPNTEYYIDISGYTFGKFDLEITGDFLPPNPLKKSYNSSEFKPGFIIKTT